MTDYTYINDPLLASYLESLVPEREAEMRAMERYAETHGFPIIGAAAGHFCYQMARISGARRIFELGSGFGYSTAWFAQAVQENGGGEVHHVVWDEDLSAEAQGSLGRMGYGDVVRYHVGEAVQVLRQTAGPFDLIFNDIDKADYPTSLPVIAAKLRSGGLLIVDNMLWYGRIFDERNQGTDTDGVREMTRLLSEGEEWVTTLVPIRDGLMVAYKK